MALDDLDDRFAAAVKVALGGASGNRNDESDSAEGSECPSADAIASYYEHGLGRVERASLETHFSRCARCQGTLAALLRAAPVPMPPPKRAAASLPRRHERRQPTRPASASAGAKSGLHGGLPGVSMAATAMLAAVVVAGMQVYQGRLWAAERTARRPELFAAAPSSSQSASRFFASSQRQFGAQ